VNNSTYASSLDSCDHWDGELQVAPYPDSLTIKNIASVTKDLLIVCDTSLTGVNPTSKVTLSMPKLSSVGGQISIENCPSSFNLEIPYLQKFGDLSLSEIGDLSTNLNSPSSPLYDAMTGSLTLSLCNLTSIVRTKGGSIVEVNAQTNLLLQNITMNELETLTGALVVTGSPNPVLNFEKLSSVSEISVGQIGGINMPQLSKVLGELEIDSNESLEALSLPSLESVGDPNRGDLIITDNSYLSTVNLGSLTRTFGNVVIWNNPDLKDLSSLGNLVSVEKNLNLTDCPFYAYVYFCFSALIFSRKKIYSPFPRSKPANAH
jgi:hypothetical protein